MARELEIDQTIPASMPGEILSQARPAALLAGRYELLGLLGVGGMGAVYRARDVELNELVALKMLSSELATAPGMIERFREEVRLARRVTHPNIARIFDIGTSGEDWFLTMELVDGESLAAVLEREGALSVARTIAIVSQVCAGVAAAHRVGIVHRDLKPDNVLLRRDGHAVVADFGIAQALADHRAAEGEGQVSGTPAYMAPEQVLGSSDIDGRADVYALGATLFECLTGRLPFIGDSAVRMATARLDAPAPDPRTIVPDLPDAIAEIVLKCTAREKDDRYANLEELGAAFDRVRLRLSLVASARALPSEVVRHTRFDRTIAVLPMWNGGADEDGYLAATLTDDLTDLLSVIGGVRVRRLDVTQLGQAQANASGQRDVRALGRMIGVHVVVEGKVTRVGDRVHVSLRLLSVADGFQLWTMSSSRKQEDFFSFGDEAAAAIAGALASSDVPEPRHVELPEGAIDLYLRGRHLLIHGSIGVSQEACELLRRAHEAAPTDARITACYGRALVRGYAFGVHASAKLAEQLLETLPRDPEAQLGLANLHFQRGEARAGARLLVKSLEGAPFLAEAVAWKGRLLLEVGPVEEGIAVLREAYELEPLLGTLPSEVARGLALLGDWPAAVEVLLSAVVGPDQAAMLWLYAMRYAVWYRDHARAELFAARLAEIDRPDPRLVSITTALHDVLRLGSGAHLHGVLPPNNRVPRTLASFAQYRAEAYSLSGEVDAALAEASAADGNGLIDISWIDHCPALETIRRESAFAPIAERVRERAAAVREVLDDA
jgi:serine/threonine-protein kinase